MGREKRRGGQIFKNSASYAGSLDVLGPLVLFLRNKLGMARHNKNQPQVNIVFAISVEYPSFSI